MLDTKVVVFTMDDDATCLGVFNLSDEQIRLLEWLNEHDGLDYNFNYATYDSVEDM